MYEKYRLTGAIPFVGAGLMVCWVPIATAAMAGIYTVAQYYIPWIYLCALITILYAGVTGVLAGWLAKRGHVRNSTFTALVALGSALLGYYVVWGTHLYLWNGAPNGSFFQAYRPDYILEWIQIGYEKGFWGFGKGGGNVSGMALAAIWVVEFAILVFGPMLIAAGVVLESIYCESCGQWLDYQRLDRSLVVDETGALSTQLQEGEWKLLYTTSPAPTGGPHLRLLLAHCPGCEELAVLKVQQVSFETNNKGEVEEKVKNVVEHALIDPDEAEMLKNTVEVVESADNADSLDVAD